MSVLGLHIDLDQLEMKQHHNSRLTLDFWLHLTTYGPPNYSGDIRMIIGEPRGFCLGRSMLAQLSAPIQHVHLGKEAIVFRGPFNSCNPRSGLHRNLNQLENKATP